MISHNVYYDRKFKKLQVSSINRWKNLRAEGPTVGLARGCSFFWHFSRSHFRRIGDGLVAAMQLKSIATMSHALQTKRVVRLVAQQPNWLAKTTICVANVGWLAGPKSVGAQSALVQSWHESWQLAGARGVQNEHTPNWLAAGWCGARAQPTGRQLAGSTDTAKQTLEWAMTLANS